MTPEDFQQFAEERRRMHALLGRIQAIVFAILLFIGFIILAAMMGKNDEVITVKKMQRETAEQVDQINKGLMGVAKQLEMIKGENRWSMEDRAEIRETVGAMKEALKRVEAKKP